MLLAGREILPGTGHAEGRVLLGQLYKYRTGQEMPPVAVTPKGKPYFEESSIHFSITHTKRHVFCVLADAPVGIDAEEENREIDLRLAEKILSPNEYSQYLAAEEKRLALLTFWVLKEAFVKCSGEGLTGYPRDTDFSLSDPRVMRHNGCLIAIISADCSLPEVVDPQ